ENTEWPLSAGQLRSKNTLRRGRGGQAVTQVRAGLATSWLERGSASGELLWSCFRLFGHSDENSGEFIAFLAQSREFVRGNNVGSDEQLEPICRFLNFAKAIAAFRNELGSAPSPIRLTIIRADRGA